MKRVSGFVIIALFIAWQIGTCVVSGAVFAFADEGNSGPDFSTYGQIKRIRLNDVVVVILLSIILVLFLFFYTLWRSQNREIPRKKSNSSPSSNL
jgi:hypothetical protein